jgi:hypothetical protein
MVIRERFVWFCAGVVMIVAGCGGGPSGPTVAKGSRFVLAPGEIAIVGDTGLQVRFDRVLGDSRCPADAICIQGGDAIVRVELFSGRRMQVYELHTGSMQPVEHDGIAIELLELSPYPFSSRAIQPDEYRATLRIL